MSDISVFLPKVLQYAQNCAEPSAYDAIRSACIEFCENTKLWREDITITLTTSATVPLTPPSGSIIHKIETVRQAERMLEPKSELWIDENYRIDWRGNAATGQCAFYTQLKEDSITFVPFEAVQIKANVSLKPTQSTETIPDFIANRYMDVIQAGALGKLLLLPNTTFYNPDLAMAFGSKFRSKLDELFSAKTSGQQRARLRVKSSYR